MTPDDSIQEHDHATAPPIAQGARDGPLEVQLEDTELEIKTPPDLRPQSSRVPGLLLVACILLTAALAAISLDLWRKNVDSLDELRETRSILTRTQEELEQLEAAAASARGEDLPEFAIEFESAEDLQQCSIRRGYWSVLDGQLVGKPSEGRARVLLEQAFSGDFEAFLAVAFSQQGQPAAWGCTFCDDGFGQRYQLEVDADERWLRLVAVRQQVREVIGARQLDPTFFSQSRANLSIESRKGLITVSHGGRVLLAGWDARYSSGRFGFFCAGPAAVETFRNRSQLDERARIEKKAVETLVEQHRGDHSLGELASVPMALWRRDQDHGAGITVDGELLRVKPGDTAWKLVGRSDWSRYLVKMEMRTENTAAIMIGATTSGSGITIEFPVNQQDTFHMHALTDGNSQGEILGDVQGVRLVPGEWYTVRALVSPTRVIVYLEDLRVYDFVPDRFPSGRFGVFGWGSLNAEFRKIQIALPGVK